MRSILFLLLFSQLILKGNATATINYPGREDWKNYFNDNLKKIQTKLYEAALEGKIKAYYGDSFTGTLTRDELLEPQGAMFSALPGMDPSLASTGSGSNVIKGISFIQKTTSIPFEFTTRQDMIGIALLISFLGMDFPFAKIKTEDLKSVLTADELSFLQLLSYHSLHGNGQWLRPEFNYKREDIFHSLHFENCTNNRADTTLIEKLATSLFTTPDLIKMMVIYDKDNMLFTDLQTGKPISHQGIVNLYNYTYDFFAEEEGYPINSITTSKDKLPQFNILFHLNSTRGSLKEIKFTLSFKTLEDKGLMPVHTWFFKDYCRWKS